MKDKGIKITAIISVTAILITLLIIYTIFQFIPTQTISVAGQSQIDVTPNLITINFNLESRATTATEAKDTNTVKYNDFVSALENLAITEDQIKTNSFNVYVDYIWQNGVRKDNGYVAAHSIQIELPTEESEKVGNIIDSGVNSGALISYINFELSKELEKEKKLEATLKATEDAKTKAEAMAQGLGKSLGKIVSVSDSSFDYYPWPLYSRGEDMAVAEAGSMAKEAIQSINPSDQTVYASVNVVYKIR
jgi:uncharacterized protein YggE